MTREELRYLYQSKKLTEAVIESSSDDGDWIVECRHYEGRLVLLTDESGREQHYKDSEEASISAFEIGFGQVTIANREK